MEEEENKKEQEVVMGTLYDMNKAMVKQAEIKLTEAILNSKKLIVRDFLYHATGSHYMLLCNEKKDYTIFDFEINYSEGKGKTIERCMNCARCLIDECLMNRGEIRGIDLTKDKTAIEIWMIIDDEAYVYYFFPYDNGVITDF